MPRYLSAFSHVTLKTTLCYAMLYTQSLSRVPLFATPWTIAHQAVLSPELSRQEYWSRLPFPIPGDLPDPGIEPTSAESPLSPAPPLSPALAGRFFATEPPGKTRFVSMRVKTYQGNGDKRKSQDRSRVHKCCVYSFCVGHQN